MDGIKIVLVEDNPADAELTIRSFRKGNIDNKIVHLKDGEEAINYFFSEPGKSDHNFKSTLIILDLRLPKVDGLEVLKRLKLTEETKNIPVVVLTSSRDDKDMIESYKLGVNSYVLKPLDFEKFITSARDLGIYWLLINKLPQA